MIRVVRRGSGLGSKAACVLKNALWAGVMDELFPPHQSLRHEYFAPGAEAIG